MKKIYLLVALLIIIFSAVSYSKKDPADFGRNTWKKNCRLACHNGSKTGVPKLAPNSKTQQQWENVFAQNRKYIYEMHKDVDFSHLSEKDWNMIKQFVIQHAYDSDQPESCETTENFVK